MGDLERRRAARDLWISRGHVKAALVGAFVLSSASFAMGYLLGRDPSATEQADTVAFLEQVPGEDLVELLARVEANRAPDGAVSALTFPDALAGAALPQGPVAPGPSSDAPPVDYVAPEAQGPEALPAPPVGSYTIEVAHQATLDGAEALAAELVVEDVASWVGARIVDGELTYVVSLGAFGSERAAEAALAELEGHPELGDAAVRPIP